MLETYEKHSKRKLIATLLSVLVIAGSVILADHFKSKSVAISSTTSTTAQPTSPVSTHAPAVTTPAAAPTAVSAAPQTSTSAQTSGYKDGSYSVSSSYYVPRSTESIQVNLTLTNGAIADVSIQNSEGDGESARYQQDFAAVYKSYVVGKKISDLQLGIIAGASDTTQGFNDALSQIASQAQA